METAFIFASQNPSVPKTSKDPWDEWMQVNALPEERETVQIVPLFEEGSMQTLSLRLCSAWAEQVLFGKTEAMTDLLAARYWIQSDPFLQVLASFLHPFFSSFSPPLFQTGLQIFSSHKGRITLPPLAQLCQLALLWAIAGKTNEAQRLAAWLLPFLQDRACIGLWCAETGYKEKEGLLSFSLLLRSVGDYAKASEYLQAVSGSIPLFYFALAKKALPIQPLPPNDLDSCVQIDRTPHWQSAFTLQGFKSSLGWVRLKKIELRAFGPQGLPLGDAQRFGIESGFDKKSKGWTCCAADREIWVQPKWMVTEEGSRLHLRWMGLRVESPLSFVFYAKASQCELQNEIFKPKSLKRYQGQAQRVLLREEEEVLEIQSSSLKKVEVIPLAGEGSFWDCDFLISFELHPLETDMSFEITKVK